jgi:hypothetical protein
MAVFHLVRSAHLSHKTAVPSLGQTSFQQIQHKEKRHSVSKCSPFPSSFPDLHFSSAIVSEQAVIVLSVCNRAAYEVRRFRLAHDSLELSAPPSAGMAVIQEIKHSSCNLQFRPQFLLPRPAPFPSRNAPPESLITVSASPDRQTAVDQGIIWWCDSSALVRVFSYGEAGGGFTRAEPAEDEKLLVVEGPRGQQRVVGEEVKRKRGRGAGRCPL